MLALVGDERLPRPWDAELRELCGRWSTNRDYAPYDLVDELTSRGLFRVTGEARTEPVPFEQPVAGYVESFHARNGFSRDRMRPQDAAWFDSAVDALVAEHCPDGIVRLEVVGRITWGVVSDPGILPG